MIALTRAESQSAQKGDMYKSNKQQNDCILPLHCIALLSNVSEGHLVVVSSFLRNGHGAGCLSPVSRECMSMVSHSTRTFTTNNPREYDDSEQNST